MGKWVLLSFVFVLVCALTIPHVLQFQDPDTETLVYLVLGAVSGLPMTLTLILWLDERGWL